MLKIGVFVCWCGSNIAATVDIDQVVAAAKLQPGVVMATGYQYMCSENGQSLMRKAVEEYKLDGVVICACSPRMHEATFRKNAQRVGLNPFMVEIANIREHCSWIHKDKEQGTIKAIALANAAIAKVSLNAPLISGESSVTKRALVIGGGIAGLQTALDIAEAGFEVDVVERQATIGGNMAKIDKTFPTLDCAACILTPKMVDAASHENIELITYSEVESVKGFVGSFKATIRKKARYVNEKTCTGCGLCMSKCPSKKSKNEFNLGLDNRTSIFIPFAQAIPNVAVIDPQSCIKLTRDKCGLCQSVCEVKAIDFTMQDEIIEREYGAIVVATGFKPIEVDAFDELGYTQNKDVITSLELERLMNAAGPTGGKLVKVSDGSHPTDITFIQCVGSRDCTSRGKEYCSKICCMYTCKHAMLIRDKYPDINVNVFYIDVRTPGKNYDEFYRRAVEDFGVNYIKGQVGKVYAEDGKLIVQGSDLITNEQIFIKSDMVVLASAIEPDPSAKKVASMLTASIDTNNFLTEAHAKLRPVESPTAGIFLSGVCQGPKDIPETVAQAGAAASKVIGLLVKNKLVTSPCIATTDELLCSGCSNCFNICPYGAIGYEDKLINDHGIRETRRIAVVNPALCQGCGACSVACPSGAMDLLGYTNKQIMAEVDAICKR